MAAFEIEVKLPVPNLTALRRRLRQLGFRADAPRLFERNLVLDNPERSLRQAGQLLRLRSKGRSWWLTWKGAPEPERRHKVRREIEVELSDGARLGEILGRLGYRPALEYQKYRTEFHGRGPGKALLDETPIGNFLELEGPSRWIDRVAAELGYRREDYILASYAALYYTWCRERGVPATGMVFQ
jgi:adenylate cyclase class 2